MPTDALTVVLLVLGAFALLLASGAIGFAVITATIARATSAEPSTVAGELLAAARESLVAGFLALRFPFDVVRRRWAHDVPEVAPRVVVLLPGYMETDALFWRLRRHLRAAGLPYVTARYALVGDPVAAAERVAAFVQRLVERHSATRIDLVGHSMGGLIARYVAENLTSPHIGQVISIASPHAGTLFGPLGVGVAARQLRRGAPFVSELADVPGHPRVANLRAPHDNIVAPRIFSAACCRAVVEILSDREP